MTCPVSLRGMPIPEITVDELALAPVMAARTLVEREPNYSFVAARLLLDRLRGEALSYLAGSPRRLDQAGMATEYPAYFRAYLRRAVNEFSEVSYAVTHLGRNDDGTDPWTPSHVEAAVGLKPYDTWPPGQTKQDLIRRITTRLDELPGFEIANANTALRKKLAAVSTTTTRTIGTRIGPRRTWKDLPCKA